eukprot:22315-Eustigmatos_ZCMA.PRE.1
MLPVHQWQDERSHEEVIREYSKTNCDTHRVFGRTTGEVVMALFYEEEGLLLVRAQHLRMTVQVAAQARRCHTQLDDVTAY